MECQYHLVERAALRSGLETSEPVEEPAKSAIQVALHVIYQYGKRLIDSIPCRRKAIQYRDPTTVQMPPHIPAMIAAFEQSAPRRDAALQALSGHFQTSQPLAVFQITHQEKEADLLIDVCGKYLWEKKELEIPSHLNALLQKVTSLDPLQPLLKNAPLSKLKQILRFIREHCPHVQSLDLQGCLMDAELFEIIASFTELTQLNIGRPRCFPPPDIDRGLQSLHVLTQLTHLNLEDQGALMSEGLRELRAFPQLRHLNVSGCYLIEDDGLQHLGVLKNLTFLDLGDFNLLSSNCIQHLPPLPQLSHLNLEGLRLSNDSLLALQAYPLLTCLDLTNTHCTDEKLQYVAQLGQLTHLILNGCNRITVVGLQSLTALRALKFLDLSNCDKIFESAQGKESIAAFSQLTHLHLRHNQHIFGQELQKIATLEHLIDLDLSGCLNVTNEGVKQIATLTKLISLKLSGCQGIGDKGAQYLQRLQRLETLHLSGCPISDVGISSVATLKRLTHFEHGGSGLTTNRCVKSLITLFRLTSLSLRLAYRMTDKELEEISEMSQLTSLHLDNVQCSDRGLEALQKLNRLTYLFVKGTEFTAAAKERFQKACPLATLIS